MATYRALVTRKVTRTENAIVVVKSSNEAYARQDVAAYPNKDWADDGNATEACEILYISEVK